MRISDWSSDVCSSDLRPRHYRARPLEDGRQSATVADTHRLVLRVRPGMVFLRSAWRPGLADLPHFPALRRPDPVAGHRPRPAQHRYRAARAYLFRVVRHSLGQCAGRAPRSEEHTSELQSLMRISYAV